MVARFEAERQALALMSHPAIAQVFDGGATPEGRPFFAMEYVRGAPITTYCNRHHLTTRQRIDLFLEICEGVQHAHQKGIIHRDLKPSNILVTLRDDRAVPKIIDFGVAKATTRSLTERTLHTEFGALVGTPEYMSPEQADMTGLDVDTRTPKTLSTLHNLGTDYARLGRYQDAERVFSDVVATKRRVLGLDHPQTVATEAELGRVYRDQTSSGTQTPSRC